MRAQLIQADKPNRDWRRRARRRMGRKKLIPIEIWCLIHHCIRTFLICYYNLLRCIHFARHNIYRLRFLWCLHSILCMPKRNVIILLLWYSTLCHVLVLIQWLKEPEKKDFPYSFPPEKLLQSFFASFLRLVNAYSCLNRRQNIAHQYTQYTFLWSLAQVREKERQSEIIWNSWKFSRSYRILLINL